MDLLEIRKSCIEQAIKLVTDPITIRTLEQPSAGGPQAEVVWIYLPDYSGNLAAFRCGVNYNPPGIPFTAIVQMATVLENYLLRAEQDALDNLGKMARTA